MISANDKKSFAVAKQTADTKEGGIALEETSSMTSTSTVDNGAADAFRSEIKSLDSERGELVKNAIENIKPGKPFDTSIVREINKIETKKNRLIVARFAHLLKKNAPSVQAIVHQIIEL
jgi:hypothetical protein